MANRGDSEPAGSEDPVVRRSANAKINADGLIVGIGASAGGLNAFKTFFSNMPIDCGMAFVLIQHLSPDHKSMLTDLLGKATQMRVFEADDGRPVEANRVFVIPPDSTLVPERTMQTAFSPWS